MADENPNVSGVAGRYATALFELARDEKSLDSVKADLDRFDAMIAESTDLERLVRSPVFTAVEQSRALSASESPASSECNAPVRFHRRRLVSEPSLAIGRDLKARLRLRLFDLPASAQLARLVEAGFSFAELMAGRA